MTAKFAGAPFDPEADAVIPLAEGESEYVYHDPRIVYAVNVAMIARRPLLVTGSPGSGKSTLADDVARRLGWALAKTTITSRTRLDDLVARFDAVKTTEPRPGQQDRRARRRLSGARRVLVGLRTRLGPGGDLRAQGSTDQS